MGEPREVHGHLERQARGAREHRRGLEALVDQQVGTRRGLHDVTARPRVTGEDDLPAGVRDGIAHRAAQPVDGREAGDRDAVAVVDRVRPVEGDLVGDRLEAGRGTDPAEGRRVPRQGLAHVLAEGREPQGGILAATAPDLDGIDPAGLREAAQQPRDVADVVGVEVREEDLGRGLDRESQRVEVCEGARAQVEEEEVLLGVADLDQERARRLAPPDPRVTTAQDRHADLTRGEGLRPRHHRRGVLALRQADHRGRRQRRGAAPAGECEAAVVVRGHS